MLSSMLVFVLWKPYSTSFHAKTLTELTLQTFSNKQRSFKSFPMHIHNVTLVKISLERRPRAFVHSFGHAKHRLLPSQIPYYSYARNLVSLDHVNSTFSQLVVFRQCRSKVLGHLARYYWNNLPSPPPPQAMLRFDTTTQISTKILFICIFQHCLGGEGGGTLQLWPQKANFTWNTWLLDRCPNYFWPALSESEYLKEIRFVAYWSMKSGACYENSCLVSKKNIFVNNIQGISIAALFVLSY